MPVSVVIPAYRAEDFIGDAINSVRAQTLPVSEIIVVDDGSPDRTSQIAESLGAVVIRQPNRGVSAARNAGIRAAASEWIAFLDADDIWEPQKIEYQWAATQIHPDVGMVSCNVSWLEDYGPRGISRRPRVSSPSDVGERVDVHGTIYLRRASLDCLVNRMNYLPSTKLVRRDLLLSVGLFDESLRYNGDFECFLRLLKDCSVVMIDRSLVQYRLHPHNDSKNTLEVGLAHVHVIERLHAQAERYPSGAAEAFDNQDLWRQLTVIGRLLLENGRTRQARTLFARSFRKSHSGRALLFWCLTFLGPVVFRQLVTIKRTRFGQNRTRRGRALERRYRP